VLVLVAGASRTFEAFQVAPGTPDAYWTVVDSDYVPVALADDYLRELRFGRGRAVSTTKAYAENLALFLDWATRSECAVENGPRELGRFVHWLRNSPVERRGAGFGRARSGQRIDTILVSVRELYKHAVSMGSLEGLVLDSLYVVGDDRFYPAHVRREDGALRTVLRPLHRVSVTRRASVDDAKPEEFAALLGVSECWRDRFRLAVMYLAGLRLG
jgi:integrase/recombinase XerD